MAPGRPTLLPGRNGRPAKHTSTPSISDPAWSLRRCFIHGQESHSALPFRAIRAASGPPDQTCQAQIHRPGAATSSPRRLRRSGRCRPDCRMRHVAVTGSVAASVPHWVPRGATAGPGRHAAGPRRAPPGHAGARVRRRPGLRPRGPKYRGKPRTSSIAPGRAGRLAKQTSSHSLHLCSGKYTTARQHDMCYAGRAGESVPA